MQYILITTLFCVVFFQGAISERIIGISYLTTGAPDSVLSRLFVEVLVALNLAWLALQRSIRIPPNSIWFGLYALWAVLSGILVEHSPYSGFMYCRYTLYAYIMYLIGWNQPFAAHELRKITRVLIALFLAQVAASAFEVLIAQERVEWRVGTMLISSGELAALFPLMALGYAVSYYLLVRQTWWVLAAGLSFGLVGYASGKRAVYFLIPATLLLTLILYYLLGRRAERVDGLRLAAHLAWIAVLTLPAFVYGIRNSQGINVAAGGSTMELLEGAVMFAAAYDSGVDANDMATGRSSASVRVAESLRHERLVTVLFGWGPDSLTVRRQSAGDPAPTDDLRITYGIVGWSRDTISIGVPGMLLYLIAYCSVIKTAWRTLLERQMHASWIAVGLGTISGLVVLVLSYLTYGSVYMFNGVITFLLLFYAGILTRPLSRVIDSANWDDVVSASHALTYH